MASAATEQKARLNGRPDLNKLARLVALDFPESDDEAAAALIERIEALTKEPFPRWQAEGAIAQARSARGDGEKQTSWAPVDLAPIVSGEELIPPPAYFEREDGARLLYRAAVHQLLGEPEATKGWFCLAACAERIEAGEHVVYLDFEDEAPSSVERLRALGIGPDAIVERFHFVRPDEQLDERAWAEIERALDEHEPTLAVLDGVTEALALQGTDIRDNTGVAIWLSALPKRIKRRGIAVLMIDHVPKDDGARGRYSIGAQHKLAGIDVSYAFRVREPWGRGLTGRTVIELTKDRRGHLRPLIDSGAVGPIAAMVGESREGGSMALTLREPEDRDAWKPTELMERISRALEEQPGMNVRQLRDLGAHKYAEQARDELIRTGYIRQEKKGQEKRHYTIRPYRKIETAEAVGDRLELA